MNILDREILIALLTSHRSIYALEKFLAESNYPSVNRYIKKLQEEKLISIKKGRKRKDGKPDKRNPMKPELTPKGLATLIIEGDLEEEELKKAMTKTLQRDYTSLPPNFLGITNVDKIFTDTLLKMKPKINLKFFDEKYFNQVFNVSLGEAIFDNFNFKTAKSTITKKKAKKLKKKYIKPQTVEDFRNLQKTFENESNKFKHYAKVMRFAVQELTSTE
jgi:hypothetical protein